jgi:hypothetical protein
MKACTCLAAVAAVSLLASAEAFVPAPTTAAQTRSVQQQQLQQLAAATAAAAGPAGSAAAAPASLRIVPNLPAADAPQRSRVPPGVHTLQLRDQSSYANAMHVDELNLHIEPIVAMACEEFKDFFARCIERNAAGISYQFDMRQWSTSIGKWWSRALEADEAARLEFARLYARMLGARRAARSSFGVAAEGSFEAEEDWEHIYFECAAAATDVAVLEELASGSRPLTVPVRSSSSNSGGSGVVQTFDDCGFHGRWQHLYDDEGHQFVDYEPL